MGYTQLCAHFRILSHLEEVGAIVEWDQAVNMPDAAGQNRAEAIATLSAECHRRLTAPQVVDWLEQAKQETDLGHWELANLREMQHLVDRAHALPTELVEASSLAEKRSEQAWRRYRAENDFKAFAPYLEEVLSLKRQTADALAARLGCSPYDALLDGYEPGFSATDIDATFGELRGFLPEFIELALERQRERAPIELVGPFSKAAQRELGVQLMKQVGFDEEAGRLDISHHPFCGGVPRDVRITTRYNESDFTTALMGILHETGHAKYEQGLPQPWLNQPVGRARGMVTHESQSLLLEMQVCRGREFLTWAAPAIRAAFPDQVKATPEAYSAENLFRYYTRVSRSFIRVDADEVTYPAHVLLRYDIERNLIAGKLSVADLPEAWDVAMYELLGLRTKGNDKDGCMQDVHWPCGLFGYFPMYTLGAMVAAQLFAAVKSQHPNILAQIERGDFEQLNAWLRKAVWSRGRSCSLAEMLNEATGEPLNAGHFKRHLVARYAS